MSYSGKTFQQMVAEVVPYQKRVRAESLAGRRFGRLIVVALLGMRGKLAAWHCKCDCGADVLVGAPNLISGRMRSCGCLLKEVRPTNNLKHGEMRRRGAQRRTIEYNCYQHIKNRCYSKTAAAFDRYGGRGIKVCDRWLNGDGARSGFECFLADMGRRPDGCDSIDRFPDNDGNYEPGNCRWATTKEQASNRRSSRHIEHEGVTRTLSEWAEHVGLRIDTLHQRLGLGWDFARSIGTPAWDETGARNNVRKLTREKVTEIRRLHAAGRSMRSLAQEFGVSCPSIRKIIRRESWATI